MGVLVLADQCEAGFIKVGVYGGPGAGKTYTMLKIATAIGKTALIDTERGAEAYKRIFKCPDGSPFFIRETRYCDEALEAVEEAVDLGCECVIVDQLTTLWESAQEEYIAKEHEKMGKVWECIEKNGTLPWTSWRHIKKPYKKLMKRLADGPFHAFYGGRLKIDYEKGGGGEPKKIGESMNAEKDTPHEPQILIKMESNIKKKQWLALVEKDRWSVIGGEVFVNPDVEMFRPILNVLGKIHSPTPDGPEDTATGTLADIKANQAQLRLVRMLGKKGGLSDEEIDGVVKDLGSEIANTWINEMTISKFSSILEVVRGESKS